MSSSMLRIASSRARLSTRTSVSRASALRFYSHGASIHDNDPEILETHKQRNLKGQQDKSDSPHDHAPGWNEKLASSSEAHVKADKAQGTPEELQGKTVENLHKKPKN